MSDRKQVRLSALDFVTFSAADEDPNWTQNANNPVPNSVIESITEASLQTCLRYGIGFIHDGLTESETATIKRLYKANSIRILVVEHKFCYMVADF